MPSLQIMNDEFRKRWQELAILTVSHNLLDDLREVKKKSFSEQLFPDC
jgi:hypothetical protein